MLKLFAVASREDPLRPMEQLVGPHLTIDLDPSLTGEQVLATLTALANYYRACGGLGLPIDAGDRQRQAEGTPDYAGGNA